MAKRLYVGNLLRALTQQELADAFEPWGPVETSIIVMDHTTGESRGFGFVDVPDDKAADAIARMHGNLFRGRPLIVNEARPREGGPREARPREGRAGGSPPTPYGRSAEGFPSGDRHESGTGQSAGQAPDGGSHVHRDTGRDRGAPRYSEERNPQEGRSGGRSKSDSDRARRDAGKTKDRGSKRGRDADSDDGEW